MGEEKKSCHDCVYKKDNVCTFHHENYQVHMGFKLGTCENFKEKSDFQRKAERKRLCCHCKYCQTTTKAMETRFGTVRLPYVVLCTNFYEPVFGESITCKEARDDERYCGYSGDDWEYKGGEQ